MPRACLVFRLPEERGEYYFARRGGDYYCVLSEVSREIHRRLKHEAQLSEEARGVYRAVGKIIASEMDFRGLSFDDVD